MIKIEAREGMTFRRLSDGRIAGDVIFLGIDYSTGMPREDLPEYYEEVPSPQVENQNSEQ